MASIQAKTLKHKLEKIINRCIDDAKELIDEVNNTHEHFSNVENQDELQEFVNESFGLLYDEIDKKLELNDFIDMTAKGILIPKAVELFFDRYVKKD